MHFLDNMRQVIGNGLRSIAGAAACWQEMLLNAMSMKIISSTIAPSHFNHEMAKDDDVFSTKLWRLIGTVCLISFLLLPLKAGAVVINNTASVDSNIGVLTASTNVIASIKTASTLELFQFSPAPVVSSSSFSLPATSYSTSGLPAGPFAPSSAPVTVNNTAIPGTVNLLPASTYKSGEPVFIRLTDVDQNNNPLTVETVLITVTTPTTGDSVILRLLETGPNTGVFTGYIQSSNGAATVNNDVISIGINERLTVSYVDVADVTDTSADSVLVDPYGSVFSTSDGALLDGATVTIVDVSTGLPATVYGDDGVSIFPATVTSGGVVVDSSGATYNYPAGGYRFPFITPGTYRLDIIPPSGYSGPSSVPTATIQTLPGAPYAIVTGSRSEDFIVNPGPALHIDYPLDASNSGLFISKQSMKNTVSVGEYLQYQLDISSTSPVGLTGTSIVDVLPVGFRYETGSARVDGVSIIDPVISPDGRTLTFSIGAITASNSIDLRYVVAVTSGAIEGEATNLANGTANGGITSNTARATVKVLEDMMPSRSHLMGRVIIGGCDAPSGDRGNVSLQLQSQTIKDIIEYTTIVNVDGVPINDLSVVVNLPDVLEYISGSAKLNGGPLNDPEVNEGQLIFNLGAGQKDASYIVTFSTRENLNAFGEFSIRAYAEFINPGDPKTQTTARLRTPMAINRVKDFSRILRPRFDSLSATLKPADLKELDKLVQSLQGQHIRRIQIIGHADKQPIRARSRSIFANNEALSQARAQSVGQYLQQALNLDHEQVDMSGKGISKQLLYSARLRGEQLTKKQQLSVNRRVEILVELQNQSPQSRFMVSLKDSDLKFIEITGPKGKLSEPGLATNLPGIKNIRLYLEDGRYVDTDEKGLFHFEGLKPGTHVVQVDIDSIPEHLEIFACEKDTRFAGTPHSQFVDMQGGTVWRADFYLRNKPIAALKGNIGLQLSSERTGEDLVYKAKIQGKGVALQQRRLVVDLPVGTQYSQGSALFDGKTIDEPLVKDDQIIFKLGDSDETVWEHQLSFTVSQTELSEGEFTTTAILLFATADGKSHQSSIAENTLVKQAIIKRKLVYLGKYQGIETGLSSEDQQQLAGVIDYLRVRKIRQVDIIAYTNEQVIAEKDRARYPNSEALAKARTNLISKQLIGPLQLSAQQIKHTNVMSKQPVAAKGRMINQRVEIFITLADDNAPQGIQINKPDSGMVDKTVLQIAQTPVVNEIDKQQTVVEQQGIQDISQDQRISYRIMPITVLLDSRLKPVFKVDGKLVADDRIAMVIPNKETGLSLYSYLGIDLGTPGDHTLSLEGLGPFGNARFTQSINVMRTGEVYKLRILETNGNIADGKTPVRIRVQLLDDADEIIQAETDLNLRSADLIPYDEEKTLPVLRRKTDIIHVDNQGYILFEPVSNSGLHNVTLSYNNLVVDIPIYVKPDYREWIMVGLAEGSLVHNRLTGNAQNLEAADINDEYFKDGRLAFYAKGKIKGEYLLTASYDSAREKPETANGLFGTIDPSKYYTLYGDATSVRYDAASTEKLFVKLESDNFYAMFGDYNTGLTVTELGRYNRSLTGFKSEYRSDKLTVTAFATETEQAFIKDEIRGEGTSGLYQLSRQNIVLNSEKITIESRDRFRSEVVLESRQLSRYIDYTFDPIAGTIYFREPIYSRDQNFNPVYIVVDYEVNSGDKQAITAGGRVAVKPLATGPEIGATLIHEGTPGAEVDLLGADFTYEIDSRTTLKAEVATTKLETATGSVTGRAYIAEAITLGETVEGKAYMRRQDGNFGLGQQQGSETGTQKIGVDGKYWISGDTTLSAEVFRQENLSTDGVRDVVNGSVEFMQKQYTLSGGARYARDKDGSGESHESTLLTGSAKRSLMNNRLDVHTSAELAIGGNNGNADYPNRLLAGADYQLTSHTQLFAEQELTFGDNQDSSTTRIGLKATPWKDATLSTSIEEQSAEYGPRVFANMGLTQGVQLNQFLRLDFGIERVQTIRDPGDTQFNVNVPPASGTVSDDFTAVTAGANYYRNKWSLTGRAEWRDGEQEDKMGLLVGFYREQSPGFGLSSALQHFKTDRVSGTNHTRTNLEFSLAYRPIESQWIILNRSRFANESARTTIGTTRTKKLINNLNANYLFDRNNQVSLMHGIKYVIDNFDGIHYRGLTNLFAAEYRHDLNHRWDVGSQVSMLMSDVGDNQRYSLGISVGHTLGKNIWLSVGYNILGFSDDDFSMADYTASGVYAKFRFTFDHFTARETMAWWEKR